MGAGMIRIHRKMLLTSGGIMLTISLSAAVSSAGGMSGTGYTVLTAVLSGGGGTLQSTSYKATSTIGQSVPIGISTSTSYINHAGFWPATGATLKKKSILWIVLPAILSGAGH